jgi:hypothetical protein
LAFAEGLNGTAIANKVGCAVSTVSHTLHRLARETAAQAIATVADYREEDWARTEVMLAREFQRYINGKREGFSRCMKLMELRAKYRGLYIQTDATSTVNVNVEQNYQHNYGIILTREQLEAELRQAAALIQGENPHGDENQTGASQTSSPQQTAPRPTPGSDRSLPPRA